MLPYTNTQICLETILYFKQYWFGSPACLIHLDDYFAQQQKQENVYAFLSDHLFLDDCPPIRHRYSNCSRRQEPERLEGNELLSSILFRQSVHHWWRKSNWSKFMCTFWHFLQLLIIIVLKQRSNKILSADGCYQGPETWTPASVCTIETCSDKLFTASLLTHRLGLWNVNAIYFDKRWKYLAAFQISIRSFEKVNSFNWNLTNYCMGLHRSSKSWLKGFRAAENRGTNCRMCGQQLFQRHRVFQSIYRRGFPNHESCNELHLPKIFCLIFYFSDRYLRSVSCFVNWSCSRYTT